MTETNALSIKNLKKSYKDFTLDIENLEIPQGCATALIGENGAGKTTLINCLSGVRLDYTGEIKYWGEYTDTEREKNPYVKEHIGYQGTNGYYLPHWSIKQIKKISKLMYEGFDEKRFDELLVDMAVVKADNGINYNKKVTSLSDGSRMKLMLAGVMARDTDLLLLDEPASPLDPLMRDKLCDMIRDYLEEAGGTKTVLFSTHNISDMEHITDYCLFMDQGRIIEQGYTNELKEKYILVTGNLDEIDAAREVLFSISRTRDGYEGICLASQLDRLNGLNVTKGVANLHQISVAIMKQNSRIR